MVMSSRRFLPTHNASICDRAANFLRATRPSQTPRRTAKIGGPGRSRIIAPLQCNGVRVREFEPCYSGNKISGHSGASRRPSNCAAAFPSHGRGRRLNPYSAHHFPGISRHISAEQEQAPARCVGRVESVHERFARAENLFSVMLAQRLDHAPQKLNCAQPGRSPAPRSRHRAANFSATSMLCDR
jgi:hypothetical protein